MTAKEPQIDRLLASALRGEACTRPELWSGGETVELAQERIRYHGIAGLLAEMSGRLENWPKPILEQVREQAIAQAMWELRHRALLSDLLAGLAQHGVVAVLLKGTAVAYDLYPSPAARSRGDSDILIASADLDRTRSILRDLGYHQDTAEGQPAGLALQEVWSLSPVGEAPHHIDLHWQLFNTPALKDLLSFPECAADPIALPRLSPDARSMDRVLTLIHTCAHRAMHLTTPYFVDGVTYYGGDRLIWAYDIGLLANALSDAEWTRMCAVADRKGLSAVCLDGLTAAQLRLRTEFPLWVRDEVSNAPTKAPASKYLLQSRQAARSWQDLRSIPGWRRKLAYLRGRLLPSSAFIRDKYPSMVKMPLALLYARRLVDLVRVRPRRSEG